MAQRKPSHGSKRNFLRRLGLEKAVKLAFGISVRGRIQPSKALDMPRRRVKKVTRLRLDHMANRQNWLHRRLARIETRKSLGARTKLQVLVNRMANWQRNQWARAGYGQKLKTVQEFLNMQRRPTHG